ncbi:GNAT family N-acetyltransferase [Cohnella faecalis]|uniref:N-acetyltransferase n=1 Tax=Cohnella faecalis TaxID=2315694 RepID=A0A398CLE0_9BACL|nr:GNAT family N-acetyltransferase [Cohnella faecalis]RIE00667.1 N-acetyltransferase [Cohnella faecalis]
MVHMVHLKGGVIILTLLRSQDADDEFLFEIYASSRLDEFANLGWPEQELNRFLRMQYEMQKISYQARYPDACYEIVADQGRRVGRMLTANTEEAVVLVDVALLPLARGQGIGSLLIRELQRKAASANKPIRLNVLADNPARRLYARLGFRETGHQFPYIAMEWNSNGVDTA